MPYGLFFYSFATQGEFGFVQFESEVELNNVVDTVSKQGYFNSGYEKGILVKLSEEQRDVISKKLNHHVVLDSADKMLELLDPNREFDCDEEQQLWYSRVFSQSYCSQEYSKQPDELMWFDIIKIVGVSMSDIYGY